MTSHDWRMIPTGGVAGLMLAGILVGVYYVFWAFRYTHPEQN